MSGSCMKWLLGWGALKRRDLLIGKERCRKGGIREKRQIWLCCVLLRVLLENKVDLTEEKYESCMPSLYLTIDQQKL